MGVALATVALAIAAALELAGPWPWLAALSATAAVVLFFLHGQRLAARHQRARERDLRLTDLQQQRDHLQRLHDQQGQLEQQLLLAKQAAEAAALAKGEFLATMSHEIRTPLNGIIPMLDLIGRGQLEAEQRQMLATATFSSQQLLRIVDDILDYSRLEANALELEDTTFNLRELLDGVVQLMQRAAEAKGLRIELEIDPAVRLSVRGDPVRLRQVLGNLLGNAIKFTARGKISVKVRRLGETVRRHALRFDVMDTGIGIAPEQQRRLFQSFSQADASTTRMYGGTGLGLAICRRIIELMQGTIGVQSQLGQGATFWFEISLSKAPGDTGNGYGPELGHLLLLSQDPALQQRVHRVGAQHGLQVQTVTTLAEALEPLRAATRPLSWLVVDGRLLRNGDASLQRALTERGDDAPQVLWLQLGNAASRSGQHWLDELVSDSTLHALLVPVRASARPAPLLGEASLRPVTKAPTTPLGLRLLLVEDNGVNLLVAQRVLEVLGCTVRTAVDGEQALQALHAGGVDVVLMDCQMPVLDGYAATQRWREHEAAHHLPRMPIIAMTANAMSGDRERCLQAGMDDYVSKPVEMRLLRSMLERWGHPETGAVAADALTDASAETLSARDADTAQPALDPSVLDELHEVIGDSTQAIITAFLDDTPALVQHLQDAAQASDTERLRGLAHSLKSSSANVGAVALSTAARRIELEARAESLEKPTIAAARVVAEFARARIALAGWRPAR